MRQESDIGRAVSRGTRLVVALFVATFLSAFIPTCAWAQSASPVPAASPGDAPELPEPPQEEIPGLPPAPQGEEQVLLQEIPSVYGASKYDQKVTEAPSSVSIVTADEIRKFNYRTLADILRSVRGFTISYDRNYSYVGVRGFSRPGDYNSRILLLIDGHTVNDNVYDSLLVGDEGIIDVDLIERIEVIRGPGSALYGSNALFAVVNIITRRGRDLRGAEVSGLVGSQETYKGRLTGGWRFQNGIEFLLSGTYLTSEGQRTLYFSEFDSPSTNNGIARNLDGGRGYNLFGAVSYGDFRLEGVASSRNKDIPTAPFGTRFNTSPTETTDSRYYFDLQYDRTFGPAWRILGRLYYDNYYYTGLYPYDDGAGGIIVNKDKTLGQAWGGEVQLTTRALERNTITVGAVLQHNLSQDQENFDISPAFTYLNDIQASYRWGLYFQDEVQILSNLISYLGVRYDRYSTFGSTVNPRFALIYNPFAATTLKALVGTAFRAPNAYELYYRAPGMKANPKLQAENIQTYELLLEQIIGKYLRGTVGVFYYNIDDLINQTIDPADETLVFRNVGTVTARGVDFELDARWPSGFAGRISFTYQRAEDAATGEVLTDSPEYLVKFQLVAPLLRDKIFAGLEVLYQSNREGRLGSVDYAVVTNLTLSSVNFPVKGLEIAGSVNNLFDQRYSDPVSDAHVQNAIRQDGRTFWLKLTYGF